MPFLTQSRFPTLWKIFQFLIGGTIDKRKLCILKYQGQQQILEVGCSLGNIATVFQNIPGIHYTGIDIDPVVIRYAQKDFSNYPNFRFLCEDLRDFSDRAGVFDYILFAGIIHHIEDALCKSLLSAAQKLMSEKGSLIVVDPLIPEPEDN
jgi:cyclopropane fatty-acyl-phospholipid synthase-like methyltransferase